jgi:hypothetical protein
VSCRLLTNHIAATLLLLFIVSPVWADTSRVLSPNQSSDWSSLSNRNSGPTSVSDGSLPLGSAGIWSIIVMAGSTLDVSAVNGGFHLKNLQTLAGEGSVSGSVTVDAGGRVSPGDDPGSIGTFSFNDNLSLASGAALDFDLATPNASDKIFMPSSMLLLSNQQFSDFTFAVQDGFCPGTYTLIDAASIQGSLGNSLSGTINGLDASISTSGGDLLLTVVPEPGSFVLLSAGAACLIGFAWRRRQQSTAVS